MSHVLYIAVNNLNGKCYVGQTKNSVDVRRKQHEKSAKRPGMCGAFSSALRKHGFANFTWFELERVGSVEDANVREIYYIDYFNSQAPCGYNLDEGGKNKGTHPETRRKLSEALTGRTGNPHTDESRRKISEALKGVPITEERRRNMSKAGIGRKHSAATREKMSVARTGRKTPEVVRRKMSESRKDKIPLALQNSASGEVRYFESQHAAARSLGLQQACVNMLAKGRLNSTGGWRLYVEPT